MRYESLGGGKYLITAKIYRDCGGIPIGATDPEFGAYAGSNGGNSCGKYSLTGFKRVAINEVTNRCSTGSAQCYPANTSGTGAGIEEHIYEGTVDFNQSPLSNFSGSTCCQVTFYTTVPTSMEFNTSTIDFNMVAMIDRCNLAKVPVNNKENSSPLFTNKFQFALCCNAGHYEAPGAVDTIDFDSTSYRLEAVRTVLPNTFGSYPFPFSSRYFITPYCVPPGSLTCSPNPFTKPPRGLSFDTAHGEIIFTPTYCAERGTRVLSADEFRRDSSGKWLKIGTTMNIISLMVRDDCGYNKSPVISGPFSSQVCGGDKICFKIEGKDETFAPFQTVPDTVKMSWDGAIPGATFNVTNPGSREKTAEFCWQTKPEHARGYAWVFTVTATDQHCSRPATNSRAFVVHVRKRIKTDTAFMAVQNCRQLILRSRADSFAGLNQKVSWIVRDSSGGLLVKTSKARDTFSLAYTGKIYTYRTISNGLCSLTLADSLIIPARPRISLGEDTSVCISGKIFIKPVMSGLQEPLKYEWKLSGNVGYLDTNPGVEIGIMKDTTVELTMSEGSGCTVRDTLLIRMLGKSVNIFNSAIPGQCSSGTPVSLKPYMTTYGSSGNDTVWSNYARTIVNKAGWYLNPSGLDSSIIYNGKSIKLKVRAQYTDTNGCAFTDSLQVQVTAPPLVRVASDSTCHSSGDYLLRNAVISPVSGFGINLEWKCIAGPPGLDLSTVIDRTGSINAFNDKLSLGMLFESHRLGNYTLVYKGTLTPSGCSNSDTCVIAVMPNAHLEFVGQSFYCADEYAIRLNSCMLLNGKYPAHGAVDYRVIEYNGDNAHPYTGKKKIIQDTLLQIYNMPGTWGIRAISQTGGCTDSADFYVYVRDLPEAGFKTNPDVSVNLDNPVFTISNESTPDSSNLLYWHWHTTGKIAPDSTSWEPTITFGTTGAHKIMLAVVDKNGCRDYAEKTVFVDEVIKLNTNQPGNADVRLNQLLQVTAPGIDADLNLYDASGKLVYTAADNSGLSGFHGRPGIYFYVLRYTGKGGEGVLTGKVQI